MDIYLDKIRNIYDHLFVSFKCLIMRFATLDTNLDSEHRLWYLRIILMLTYIIVFGCVDLPYFCCKVNSGTFLDSRPSACLWRFRQLRLYLPS